MQNSFLMSSLSLFRGIYKLNQVCFLGREVNLGINVTVRPMTMIEDDVVIGSNTFIGYGCVIREYSIIGENCSLGHLGVMEGGVIKDNTRIHAQFHIAKHTVVGSNVFAGPFFITLNHKRPDVFRSDKYPVVGAIIGDGCRIGANVTIMSGVYIGDESFIGAGSIVTKDVLSKTLVYGNPAKQKGLVSKKEWLKK